MTTKDHEGAARRFEAHRADLQRVAYRMLGSRSEAEDAVQESWLRLARVDVESIENLGAWLRTVVARVCLDMLRARASRRENLAGEPAREDDRRDEAGGDPEAETLLADAVGRALLVVLETLTPAERVAFVLHDLLGVSFDEVAPVVDRSVPAAKKLASRARLKVRGAPPAPDATGERDREWRVVAAFLAASRAGDIEAIVALLAPDVVRRADAAALAPGRPAEVRGRDAVAKEIAAFGRNARFAEVALVDDHVGIVVAPGGRLRLVIRFVVAGEQIAAYELVAERARLARSRLAVPR